MERLELTEKFERKIGRLTKRIEKGGFENNRMTGELDSMNSHIDSILK